MEPMVRFGGAHCVDAAGVSVEIVRGIGEREEKDKESNTFTILFILILILQLHTLLSCQRN